PLGQWFCQYPRAGADLLVEDAREDARLRQLPAVTGLGLVAYAGVPLLAPGASLVRIRRAARDALDRRGRWHLRLRQRPLARVHRPSARRRAGQWLDR